MLPTAACAGANGRRAPPWAEAAAASTDAATDAKPVVVGDSGGGGGGGDGCGSKERTCRMSSAGAPPPEGSHTTCTDRPHGCALLNRAPRALHSTQGPNHFPGWILHARMHIPGSQLSRG
eukprot:1153536-Pelagomonas_calceolata.AAC.3